MPQITNQTRRAAHDLLFRILPKVRVRVALVNGVPNFRGKIDGLPSDVIHGCRGLREEIIECLQWFSADWSRYDLFVGWDPRGTPPADPNDPAFDAAYGNFRRLMTAKPTENQNGQDTQEEGEATLYTGNGTSGDPAD